MKRHGPGKTRLSVFQRIMCALVGAAVGWTIGFFVVARWFPGNAEACMIICAVAAFILAFWFGELAVRAAMIILGARPPDDKERRR